MSFSFSGAPFAAAMEVIIYAGALMVLFIFVVVVSWAGPRKLRAGPPPAAWIGPGILAAILSRATEPGTSKLKAARNGRRRPVSDTAACGASLMGPYLLGVELASVLLLVGLIGAFHLGYRLGAEETPAVGGAPWALPEL